MPTVTLTLIGGAGNDAPQEIPLWDNLYGDYATSYVYRDWSLTRSIEEKSSSLTVYKSTFARGYYAEAPTTGAPPETLAGDDRIFGGAGDDWIQGNGGDDYIDGLNSAFSCSIENKIFYREAA